MRLPKNPFHPGEMLLEEFLVPGKMTQAALAKKGAGRGQQLVEVELAPDFISTLAGYKKAAEITPAYFMVLLATPLFAEGYQERKRAALSHMVLAVSNLKNEWFYAYMNAAIYTELLRHAKPSS